MGKLLIVCAAILLLSGSVQADSWKELRRGACGKDIERLCPDAKPRGGGLGTCLRGHRDELSEGCAADFAKHETAMRERAAAVKEACASEAAAMCPDKGPGEGGLIRCLRSHQSELSESCRKALPPRRGRGERPKGP